MVTLASSDGDELYQINFAMEFMSNNIFVPTGKFNTELNRMDFDI